MSEKDLTEKILEDYNDVFADIINVLIFNGEQRIKPDSLVNASSVSQYKTDDGTLREMERDVIKNWTSDDYKVNIAVCGIENQTKVERLMPLRIFGYEGASYRSQVSKISSKDWKGEKPVPVVTLILYFGTSHWVQPKRLKDLMDIPEGLDPYVNDLNINVFEISWLTEEQLSMFKSDFGIVARFFVKKRIDPNYIPDDSREIKHVDAVLKLLSAMTNDVRYQENIGKRRITTMCDVADRLEKRGIEKGRLEGRLEGKREGILEGKNILLIEQVLKKVRKGKSLSQIADELEEDEEVIKGLYDKVIELSPDFSEEKVVEILCGEEVDL